MGNMGLRLANPGPAPRILVEGLSNCGTAMRISAKAEYACLTVIELARSQLIGRPMRVREIAESQDIPERYLVQILLQLKSAGFVRSLRGSAGGYTLMRDAGAITLAEVITTFDGPGEPPRKSGSPAASKLGEALERARTAELVVLSGVRIAELVGREVLDDYVL
jgi:Rrf2 family transcriptional regulator, cysteine metabolism repressor